MSALGPCDQCGKPASVRYMNAPGQPTRCWDHTPRLAEAYRHGWLPGEVEEAESGSGGRRVG